MHLQTQSFSINFITPTTSHKLPNFPKKSELCISKSKLLQKKWSRCSLSAVSERTQLENSTVKPYPAEVSRTIMELSSVGTFSSLTNDGWPLGIGVRFAVDSNGTPIICFNQAFDSLLLDKRSSLHVQLEQCGLRTPQLTIQGKLDKPEDKMFLKNLYSAWERRFGETIDERFVYVVAVERVLQMEDFKEDGVWVSSSDYVNANPDPLRNFAESFVNEINANNMEDVHRFCNVYVDVDFQVSEAKMIWVDRLGFDVRILSPQEGAFEVRIPFPREVADEKGAKSSFNGMSQQAWEIEKNFHPLDFKKVKQLKQISYK